MHPPPGTTGAPKARRAPATLTAGQPAARALPAPCARERRHARRSRWHRESKSRRQHAPGDQTLPRQDLLHTARAAEAHRHTPGAQTFHSLAATRWLGCRPRAAVIASRTHTRPHRVPQHLMRPAPQLRAAREPCAPPHSCHRTAHQLAAPETPCPVTLTQIRRRPDLAALRSALTTHAARPSAKWSHLLSVVVAPPRVLHEPRRLATCAACRILPPPCR